MENEKVELLDKLNKEKIELLSKIKKLEEFRLTEKWNELSVSHKQLLDIQLQAMRTYLECLIGRCVDLLENENDEKDDDITTIIIIKGETNE